MQAHYESKENQRFHSSIGTDFQFTAFPAPRRTKVRTSPFFNRRYIPTAECEKYPQGGLSGACKRLGLVYHSDLPKEFRRGLECEDRSAEG